MSDTITPRVRMRWAAITTATCTFGFGIAVGSMLTMQIVASTGPAFAEPLPVTDPLGHLATVTEPVTTASPELALTEPTITVTEPLIVPEIAAEPLTEPDAADPVTEEEEGVLTSPSPGVGPAMDLVPGRLPACFYEDSEDCIWDAGLEGNGVGTSFIRYDGVTYYPEGSGW